MNFKAKNLVSSIKSGITKALAAATLAYATISASAAEKAYTSLGLPVKTYVDSSLNELERIKADEKSMSNLKDTNSLSQSLPSPLTQTSPDFYKEPEKEFREYRETYIEFASDGFISISDTRGLEFVLRNTLNEIDGKIKENRLLERINKYKEAPNYLLYIHNRNRDLLELQKHLELFEKWKASPLATGKFIHYGSGFFQYSFTDANEGNTDRIDGQVVAPSLSNNELARGLPAVFRDDIYAHFSPSNLIQPNIPKVTHPDEEILPKTKIDYWLGLGLGLATPWIALRLGRCRRRKTNQSTGDIEENAIITCVANQVLGWTFLDSLHPIVYLARILAPLIYEGYQWGHVPFRLYSSSRNSESQTNLEARAQTSRGETIVIVPDNSPNLPDLAPREITLAPAQNVPEPQPTIGDKYFSALRNGDQETASNLMRTASAEEVELIYNAALKSENDALRYELPPRLEINR